MDEWKENMRAELTEAVIKDCRERLQTEVIDGILLALLYDFNPAQNQTIADTFVHRDIKSNLADESKSSTSYIPLHQPTDDPRSPFNIDDTHTADAQVIKAQTTATKKRKADNTKTKESSKARKVPKKGKAKQVGQNQLRISPEGRQPPSKGKKKRDKDTQMRISPEGRLIAAAEESSRT